MLINLNYYDQEEREKIERNFPHDFPYFEALVGKNMEVSYEDFKVYSVFGYQYNNDSRFRSFIDLSAISANISNLETILHYDQEKKSIIKTITERPVLSAVSEQLGIAGGLTVASKIYALTQADWQLIEQTTKHKDFDFNIMAASHRKYVNIETKGCITENNQIKSSAVSYHKSNIVGKKNNIGFKEKYNYDIDTCLGFITVADSNNILQVWLLDPIFERPNILPITVRLLKRSYYYYQLLYSILPRAPMTVALANRYKVLQTIERPSELDGIPLFNPNMERIYITESFFNGKTTDNFNSIIGRMYFTNNKLIFIGMTTNCLQIILNQNQEAINSFAVDSSTRPIILNSKVSKRYEQSIKALLAQNKISNVNTEKSQITFTINMRITIASSGICLGYLFF